VLGGGHSEGQRHESSLFCFGAFVAALVAMWGTSLVSKHRGAWGDGPVTHPNAVAADASKGKGHTLVLDLRTDAGFFRVRLVWWDANFARDASKELIEALGQILPPEVTNEELAQARAALVTRFSPNGVKVLQLALAKEPPGGAAPGNFKTGAERG
jgi:hypothetical protein